MKINRSLWQISLIILLVAVLLSLFFSPLASPWPDGLEKSAENLGFGKLIEGKPLLKSPFPDYIIPALKNEKISTSLAGLLGTIITFVFVFLLVKILKTGKK